MSLINNEIQTIGFLANSIRKSFPDGILPYVRTAGKITIFAQFLRVQDVYSIERRGGRRLYHEVFNLTDEDFKRLCFDLNQVSIFAQTICNVYYQMGHQVVYAIHYEPEEHLHIHFVVNTINFRTGRKWHEYKASTACREMLFNKILRNQQCIIIKKIANIC